MLTYNRIAVSSYRVNAGLRQNLNVFFPQFKPKTSLVSESINSRSLTRVAFVFRFFSLKKSSLSREFDEEVSHPTSRLTNKYLNSSLKLLSKSGRRCIIPALFNFQNQYMTNSFDASVDLVDQLLQLALNYLFSHK